MKNWRYIELNAPFLLKPIISLLKEHTNYSSYVVDGNPMQKGDKELSNYAIVDKIRIKKGYRYFRYLFTKT